MKTALVQMGNSRGIRIPKAFLEQCRFQGEVDVEIRDGGLFIRPVAAPRSEWDEAFQQMHAHGDDALLDKEALSATAWDTAEWEW